MVRNVRCEAQCQKSVKRERTRLSAPAYCSAWSGTSVLPSWWPHDARSSSAGLPSWTSHGRGSGASATQAGRCQAVRARMSGGASKHAWGVCGGWGGWVSGGKDGEHGPWASLSEGGRTTTRGGQNFLGLSAAGGWLMEVGGGGVGGWGMGRMGGRW